jgi:PmbA protein
MISAGQDTEDHLFAGQTLEIIELQGLHSGTDPISGDFSLGANGFLHQDGQRVQAVRGITVAGNFYKMLNEIEAIGDQVHSAHHGCFFSPLVRFASLQIAG